MKKFIITTVLALILSVSAAQAATFTFTSQPADISDFTLSGSDVDARFTDFSWYNGTVSTLYDYQMGPGSGATIAFSITAILDSINFVNWDQQAFSGKAYLNGAATDFDGSTFASLILNQAWDSIYFEGTFGITEVRAHATPIPGAAWLLGSGLIGLVGLRRKFLA